MAAMIDAATAFSTAELHGCTYQYMQGFTYQYTPNSGGGIFLILPTAFPTAALQTGSLLMDLRNRACLLIRKHDYFTPTREIKRHVK